MLGKMVHNTLPPKQQQQQQNLKALADNLMVWHLHLIIVFFKKQQQHGRSLPILKIKSVRCWHDFRLRLASVLDCW